MLQFEKQVWQDNKLCIGIDEAGRGAFAGPLSVAAVVFEPEIELKIKKLDKKIVIRDSKKMTELQRLRAHQWIIENCLDCSSIFIDPGFIDSDGLTSATQKGFISVVDTLYANNNSIEKLLIDGFGIRNHQHFNQSKQVVLTKGEDKSISIAAASILAKVERDNYMKKLSKQFPQYDWHSNKGYGTASHRKAISDHGLSAHHRRLFIKE